MDSYDNEKTDKGMFKTFEELNEERREELLKELNDLNLRLPKARKRRDAGLRALQIERRINTVKRALGDLGVSV